MSVFTPSADEVRAIRKFKMLDPDLENFITMAERSPRGQQVVTTAAISTTEQRKDMLTLLAAHLATAIREPEPISVRTGQVTIAWQDIRAANQALTDEVLSATRPGMEFIGMWKQYNRPSSRFIR